MGSYNQGLTSRGSYNEGFYIWGLLEPGFLQRGFLEKGGLTSRVYLYTYINTILRGLAFMGVTFRFLMLRGLKFWSLIFRRYDNVFETNEREMETRLKIVP